MKTMMTGRNKSGFAGLCALLLLAACLIFLSACNSAPKEKSEEKPEPPAQAQAEDRSLTPEEIAQVNEAFDVNLEKPELKEISHFFTSYYDKVQDLDMGAFTLYCPRESELTDADADELAALRATGKLPFNGPVSEWPVGIGRIPYDTVEGYLESGANLSIADMTNMENALFLDEYKCFYSYASDFGPGHFHCVSGEIEGDTLRLQGESAVLTMKKDGERYHIVSHQQLP